VSRRRPAPPGPPCAVSRLEGADLPDTQLLCQMVADWLIHASKQLISLGQAGPPDLCQARAVDRGDGGAVHGLGDYVDQNARGACLHPRSEDGAGLHRKPGFLQYFPHRSCRPEAAA
jgi:hypothetical protein